MVVFFLNNQRLLFKAVIVTFSSGLTLPLLPERLTLFHVLASLYIAIVIVSHAFRKQTRVAPDGLTGSIILFFLVLLMVIGVRGMGFRFLGDENWGGLRYLELFIMLGLLINAKAIILRQDEWRKTLIVGLLFTLVPFLAELVFLLSGGAIWRQYLFVNVNLMTMGAFLRDQAGHEMVRFQSANRLGGFIMITSLFFLLHKPRRVFLSISLYLFALLLIGFSGHRSGFFDLIFFPWIVGLIYFKKHLAKYLFISTAGLVAALVILYTTAALLPMPFQRAVSWLPGIQVNAVARQDADMTLQWRFEVWDAAFMELRQNPDFLLIGKGLTYSAREHLALGIAGNFFGSHMWAVITSTYHQGFISLLVILGIPGLIAGSFLLGLGLYYNRPAKINQEYDDVLSSAHLLFFAYTFLLVGKFYTIYGDIHVSFPVLFFWFLVLENLRYSSKVFSENNENISY